ncbi:MAG: permease [Desulfuromonas sp.]|nr:permease [Desulfuromonas sp.]
MADGAPKHQPDSRPRGFVPELKRSAISFAAMLPMLLGIIALVGLFQTIVTPRMLASIFQGNAFIDTLIGTLSGAAALGTPVISYLLGGELLAQGVSMYAVSAFMLAWVTLGFTQLPIEIEALGSRFTLQRNLLAFFFTMAVAVLTTITVGLLL